jgi:hypothetical protein
LPAVIAMSVAMAPYRASLKVDFDGRNRAAGA